jgi:hypothetical protein
LVLGFVSFRFGPFIAILCLVDVLLVRFASHSK